MIDPNCVTGPAKWDYNWTESKLRDFVGFVESRSISKLYFWRADIDDEGECTAPYYYFDVARRCLRAALVSKLLHTAPSLHLTA